MKLEDFFDQVRSVGQLDSSGAFSLEWTRAAAKLGEYRLADPYHYILRLVRCGVLAEASRIDIQTRLDRTDVSFDGRAATTAELERLLDHLLKSSDSALQELATASAAALTTRPLSLVLEVSDGRRGARLELGQEERFESTTGRPPGTHFRLRRKPGKTAWLRGLKTLSPEGKTLGERCHFCPIPLQLNGRSMNRPQEFARPFLFEGRYPGPGPNLVALPMPSRARGTWGGDHRLVSCAIGVCASAPSHFSPEQKNEFIVVHAGVTLYRQELPLHVAPLMGILSTEGLTLDVSGDKVVWDRSFQTRVDWLGAHASWLLSKVKKR